jgi:hypothetical protein
MQPDKKITNLIALSHTPCALRLAPPSMRLVPCALGLIYTLQSDGR